MRKLKNVVVSCILFLPLSVMALGLGEIQLESNLNEPLKASITLLSTDDMQASEIIATLASDREFDRAGIERFFYLNAIRFQTVQKSGGKMVVELRTRDPIKEPFVNFLVELNWPAGKIVREYTLLLDPPIFDDARRPAPVEPVLSDFDDEPQQVEDSPVFVEPEFDSDGSVPVIEDFEETEFIEQDTQPQSALTYMINPNDTAWSIAKQFTPQGASIYQTIVAIYEANPQAFDGDINVMKKGETLTIPGAGEINQVSPQDAVQVVTAQINSYNERLGRIDVGAEGELVSEAGGSARDRLELISAEGGEFNEDGAGGAGDVTALRRQLGIAKEASETLRLENNELRDRLDALSDQVEKMQRLISLKDDELAALSAKLGEELDFSTDTDQFLVDDELSDDGSIALDGESTPAANAQPSLMDDIQAGKYNDYLMYGAGGLVLVLGVFYFMRRRMAEEEFEDSLLAGEFDADMTFGNDFGEMEETSSSIGEEIVENDIEEMAADPISEADVYIAYGKYPQAEELLQSALKDDPSAQDVHLKLFECYAEAKEQAKFQAHVNTVQDMIDVDKPFEDSIQGLFSQAWPEEQLDTHTDALMANAEELPSTDDIFGEVEDESLAPPPVADERNEFSVDDNAFSMDSIDQALEESASESLTTTEAFDSNDDLSGDLDDLEFDLDSEPETDSGAVSMQETAVRPGLKDLEPAPEPSEPVAFEDPLNDVSSPDALDDVDVEASLDVGADLDAGLDFEPSTPTPSEAEQSKLDDDLSDLDDIDIDFEQDIVEQLGGDMEDTSEYSGDLDAGIGDDMSFVDEELEGTLGSSIADVDEASTKLDLARAYIDMGDSDGARDILNEVMSEGNTNQQSEARALLEKI